MGRDTPGPEHPRRVAMTVPFSHPHDSELAGLRDYRSRLAVEERQFAWLRWVMLVTATVALLTLLAFSLMGCAWRYPPADGTLHLDAVHPSAERIAQLASLNLPPVTKEEPWLRLTSPQILAGGAVRMSCFIPASSNHRYLRLALMDEASPIKTSTHQANYSEYLIESVPCGTYLAICDSLSNSKVLTHLEQALTARGSCNAGGEDR